MPERSPRQRDSVRGVQIVALELPRFLLMATTMSEAIRECLETLGGVRSGGEIWYWFQKHYPRRWASGTLRDHLYGGRVNYPLAFKHHPGQKKFLFDHTPGGPKHRYELYDPARHGFYRVGRKVAGNDAPSWILVHNAERYKDAKPDNPQDELAQYWRRKRWNRLWHWKLAHPMHEDTRPRKILLGWDKCVFGEATATVTQDIDEEDRDRYNFAFRLSDYQPLRFPIPFVALRLGGRARRHRNLIKIDAKVWRAYRVALRGQAKKSVAYAFSESEQIAAELESALNPRFGSRQGFGLSAEEKRCVELHAMNAAKKYLKGKHFEKVEDVSERNPFDLLATRRGSFLSVEVKGTTGHGAEIRLTRGEVRFQQMAYPANMLIVVHSIKLKRGTEPKASGGKLRVFTPWKLDARRLLPQAYSYEV